MPFGKLFRRAVLATCLTIFAQGASAQSDTVADFYKGKEVAIIVAHFPGTGFDIYSRVLVRHMGRHIPGNPTMVVKNMAGASGITAANWLYASAPKDGTHMGIFAHTVALENVFGNEQARFDAGKFIWVGNIEKSATFCVTSRASGVTTFDDLRKKQVIFGGTGATGPLVVLANGIKNLTGANIKLIPGYKGALDVKAAIQRNEVGGVCGMIWSHLQSAWKDMLDSGEIVPVVQTSGDPVPGVKAAHVRDFIKNEEDEKLFGLVFLVGELGRNYALPPGVPAERVAALRKAFMATMADAEFRTEATKLGVEVAPSDGAEVERAWRAYASSSPAIVERAKKAISMD